MKIKYLDGFRLKQAIIAGSRVIINMQKNLNKINVFPVPDGDTGTNMAQTMNSVSNGLAQCSQRSIEEVSMVVAESALMGAQGNSGAILAQFFNGFAEAVKGKLRITAITFAEAVKQAKNAAFEAISNPREGTILTVIKDWSNQIEEMCRKTGDFVEIFQGSLTTARKSLAETPQKLKILAKAGVVDAGAQGFVHLLEGITSFIEKGKLNLENTISTITTRAPRFVETKLEFQYCTECLVRCENTTRAQLQQKLLDMGDSLIIVNKGQRFRIHIHTNFPQQVFQVIEQMGVIEKKKIDDMAIQHEHIAATKGIAVITDSACDLPHKFLNENKIFLVPTKLSFGPETYLDKIEITPVEFYNKLLSSQYHPTTSQPSLASFKDVYEQVVQDYDAAISIHLPRVASGTLQGAEKAAAMFGQDKITCIDGKNVSVALGFIVMAAVNAINEGDKLEEVVKKTEEAVKNTYLFASLATTDYLVRGGRIGKPKWILSKLFNIKVIVTFDKTGRAVLVGKAIGEKAIMEKTLKLVRKAARPYRKLKFMVAHANAYNKATWYVEQLKKIYDIENIPIIEAAPVLGVHAGPGTAAIAFTGKY